jgi:hypothetical protein
VVRDRRVRHGAEGIGALVHDSHLPLDEGWTRIRFHDYAAIFSEELHEARFGAMTSVAALGFGDVPPEVFTAAFGHVEEGGWIAFTIKEDFLDGADDSGFAALIAGLLRSGAIEERDRRRYQHRLDVNGDPIHYVAIAGVRR